MGHYLFASGINRVAGGMVDFRKNANYNNVPIIKCMLFCLVIGTQKAEAASSAKESI